MNLTIIPFHDWRKNQKEGFRTRDSHLINNLYKSNRVNKVLVINRPTTIVELFHKKTPKKIRGKVILSKKKFTLYEVETNLFVVDFISNDVMGQITKRQKWFIDKYYQKDYLNFIKECWDKLSFGKTRLITQNIFAYKLAIALPARSKLFDAWDNFLKFPAYQKIRVHLKEGYQEMANEIKYWTTNSTENIDFYKSTFGVDKITLLKNGVNINFAKNIDHEPADLALIKKPIIGFGGKISYLLDVNLINYIVQHNKDLSFVFVGQILNKQTFNAIDKEPNIYFLGDKHYNEYPSYVKNFDICIIPYNTGKGQHGGDSIKAYEYLSTGKKVVGTNGNGLEDLKDYIYIANTPKEFSDALKDNNNNKLKLEVLKYSWNKKAQTMIDILNEEKE